MTSETKPSEEKKKPLPPGIEQIGLKQYKELHKRELEKRHSDKKTSKTVDNITQIIMIIVALPLLGLIIYFAFCFLLPPK